MGVLQGSHPVTRDMACNLAALQCQIQYGDLQEGRRSAFIEQVEHIIYDNFASTGVVGLRIH